MGSEHTLTVYFDDGETEYVGLKCNLTGADRPCAVISCPVDHEDVSRACIDDHAAIAKDECWAESWYEAGGRDGLNTEALAPVSFPVRIYFDEGVIVENDGGNQVSSE